MDGRGQVQGGQSARLPTALTLVAIFCSSSKPELVVLLVCTDPEPDHIVSLLQPHRPVMIPHPHHTGPMAANFKTQRGVVRILFPNFKLRLGQPLDLGRQRIVSLPKTGLRPPLQGRSRVRPAW